MEAYHGAGESDVEPGGGVAYIQQILATLQRIPVDEPIFHTCPSGLVDLIFRAPGSKQWQKKYGRSGTTTQVITIFHSPMEIATTLWVMQTSDTLSREARDAWVPHLLQAASTIPHRKPEDDGEWVPCDKFPSATLKTTACFVCSRCMNTWTAASCTKPSVVDDARKIGEAARGPKPMVAMKRLGRSKCQLCSHTTKAFLLWKSSADKGKFAGEARETGDKPRARAGGRVRARAARAARARAALATTPTVTPLPDSGITFHASSPYPL